MIKKKKSQIHGYGVFATRPITKNTKVVQYTGEKISSRECDRREIIYEKRGEVWTFELSSRWYIDAAVGGGVAKYVNHSNSPNCWIDIKKGEIWYRASRCIKSGEELTVDYGTPIPN